jgi:Universal stress protein family
MTSLQADLIVAGTHGRRGPGRWWLGSVAERASLVVMATSHDRPSSGITDSVAKVRTHL